ncbi:MAG: lamin tail domain-containing protein, partial [Tannerella sp.]|nr:lamin tail domain-containing protein [Tannerella sp.]
MKPVLLFLPFLFMSVYLSAQNADNSQSGDIIINEVMADPVGLTALPQTEYVEIHNASGRDLSLSGWVFLYGGKEAATLPDTVLHVGGYAVLYRLGSGIVVAEGALSLGLAKFPSALANEGKTIGLKNSKGVLIDEIAYPKAKKGKSYERDAGGVWHLCMDERGGTPGEVNSPAPSSDPGQETDPDPDSGTGPDPGSGTDSGTDDDPSAGTDPVVPPSDESQPGDIIINEVMADPVGLMALPETEYVEIYNVSGRDLSLSGWVFLYDGRETALPDTVLRAGGYAVLYRSGHNIMVAEGALSFGLAKFPSALSNNGK